MKRTTITSGTPWEFRIGYSRAVRVGPHVHVSGTTAVDDEGQTLAAGDAHGQTVAILQKIERALKACGAELAHVVRTRIYVTDIAKWDEVGRAHGDFFGEIRPTTSMVEVSRLIAPDLLVEIEAEAIVSDPARES